MSNSIIAGLTSLLFVPGSRPERFAKAQGAGADLVCIDLEDAVAADDKDAAREAALAQAGMAVRINGVATRAGLADLLTLAGRPTLPPAILIPMVESPEEVRIARAVLGETARLIPLVETPRGLRHAREIASAPGVAAMMFGGGDMAGELGVALAWDPLLAARAAFILACAEAGVPAIDVPWIAMDDAAGLAEECAKAKALGFQAKAAIHPAQVAAIHAAFRPDSALIAEAEAAREAYAAAGGAAVRFNGRMLEAPIMRRYEKILAMAKGSTNA